MSDDDDCQIFALLGRELLGWGERAPDASQFPIFYRPYGGGYVEQCPWAALGVTPLPPETPIPESRRFFTQPVYSADGETAEAHFVTHLVSRDEHGRPLAPSINQVDLTLRKVAGRWTLTERRQGPMT
jgi:hypothetical protein